jgi:hypothetical protein
MGILRPLPEPAAHSFDRRLDPFIDQLYLPRRQNSVAPSIGFLHFTGKADTDHNPSRYPGDSAWRLPSPFPGSARQDPLVEGVGQA